MSLRSARVKEEFEFDTTFDHERARGLQYNPSLLGNRPCQDLEIVDACRGMSMGRMFVGKFEPYEGDCDGEFYNGLPIYYSAEKKLYLYALDMYPEDWSSEALRGLIRWRIASFQTYSDKTTCRLETANIYQVDFAANGQPYNYHPTMYCFDESGHEFSGFKVSTITVICNDIVVAAPTTESSDDGGGSVGVVIGIIAVVLLLLVGGYFWTKRQKERGEPVLPCMKPEDEESKKKREAEKEQIRRELDERQRKREEEAQRKQLEESENDEEERLKREKELLSSSTKESAHTNKTEEAETSDEEPRSSKGYNNFIPKNFGRNNSRAEDDSIESSDKSPRIPRNAFDTPAPKEDAAVPKEIRSMVEDLDNYFDNNLDAKPESSRHRSSSRGPEKLSSSRHKETSSSSHKNLSSSKHRDLSSSRHKDKSSSRHKDLSSSRHKDLSSSRHKDLSSSKHKDLSSSKHKDLSSSKHKDLSSSKHKDLSSSRHKERLSRSGSRSRIDDDEPKKPTSSRSRSRSVDRRAQEGLAQPISTSRDRSRSVSRRAEDDYAKPSSSRSVNNRSDDDLRQSSHGRSRSIQRRGDSDYPISRPRSRSIQRNSDHDYPLSRSGSVRKIDKIDLDDQPKPQSRSRSIGRDEDDSRPQSRSRSGNRSNDDDYTPRARSANENDHTPRARSLSRPRDRSDDPASRGRSLEPNNRSASFRAPVTADDGFKSTMPIGTIGRSKAGSTALDASKANRTVTKQDDGSVLVVQKRTREDGAIVTTKTKYANVGLARKHGVEVD